MQNFGERKQGFYLTQEQQDRLANLRERAGVTETMIDHAVFGVKRAYRRKATGERLITLDDLQKIADYFKVTPRYVMTGEAFYEIDVHEARRFVRTNLLAGDSM